MPDYTAKLLEVYLDENGETAGRLAFPAGAVFRPGQYFLAQPIHQPVAYAEALFPVSLPGPEVTVAAPLPPAWQPGIELAVSGPLGNGFHLPPAARRVALAARYNGGRLRALLELALAQGADVTLYLTGLPAELPVLVEVQPFDQLAAALAWADYLAVDVPLDQLNRLNIWLGLDRGRAVPIPVEVLLGGSFPCGGLAECGVCAVETRRGYKLACKDGPVFYWKDLELS